GHLRPLGHRRPESDRHEDLVGRQRVLALRLLDRRLEQLLDGYLPLALRAGDLGRGAQRDQRWGERRGVDDDAGVALGEDRVVLVLALLGVALAAALEQADDVLVAEVPAPVPLA